MTRPLTTTLLSLSALAFASCASDFAPDRSRPVPTRAVQSPVETNSAEAEVLGPSAPAVPLVTVDSSGTRGDHPTVRTIYDNVRDTINPPVTPSAATFSEPPNTPPTATIIVPATEPAAPPILHVDPITGE